MADPHKPFDPDAVAQQSGARPPESEVFPTTVEVAAAKYAQEASLPPKDPATVEPAVLDSATTPHPQSTHRLHQELSQPNAMAKAAVVGIGAVFVIMVVVAAVA